MNSILLNILIFVIIVFILYLCIVLYRNFYKNELKDEIIVNNVNETFELGDNTPKQTREDTNKNLEMKVGFNNDIYNVELKLYDNETPLTCKNFRTIAKQGINGTKYNGNTFHRVIKNFMLQGGDIINGDGSGSISIYGDKFKDENLETKHNKPGLLSMANSGPNTNGSQFFITTVETPHLDGKHVIFGEVVKGFEYIKLLENVKTDSNNRPYQDIKIIDIREMWN